MVAATPRKRVATLLRPVRKSLLAAIERDRWIGYPAGNAGLLRLGELFAMRPRVNALPPNLRRQRRWEVHVAEKIQA
jgi:hypothetical protein